MNIFQIITAPFLGGVIGWVTNDIAVRMLFRPYKPLYILGLKFHGAIPSNHERLAGAISNIITTQLLSKDELSKKIRELILNQKNIESMVDYAFDANIQKLKDKENLSNVSLKLSEILSSALSENIPAVAEKLIQNEGEFANARKILRQIIYSIVKEVKISPEVAEYVVNKSFSSFLSPKNIREIIIEWLNEQNIDALKKSFNGDFLAEIITEVAAKPVLVSFRKMMERDTVKVENYIHNLVETRVKKVVIQGVVEIKPAQRFTLETIDSFEESAFQFVHSYVKNHHKELIDTFNNKINLPILIYDSIMAINPEIITSSEQYYWLKKELSKLIYNELEKNTDKLIDYLLTYFDFKTIIKERILSFSPQKIEVLILEIANRELKFIIYIGGILGFVIGLTQALWLMLS